MEVNKQRQPITIAGGLNSRVHILEVIGNASKGGMESYIENFIARLPPDQFQVTCICPYESAFTASLRQLGVRGVFITPIADDPTWHSIQMTMEVARLHQIDVLHAHMPKAHLLAGLAGCLIHKPVVATVHGMEVSSYELGVTRAVGSHLITNCQEAYTQALALGVPSEQVALVRNGVDTSVFIPDHSGEKLRAAIKVPRGIPLIGFVGRLDYEKGPDLFLRAADYVHNLRPDVHFVMVGDGAMDKELRVLCTQMGLNEQVHFVGWSTNVADIYPALDVLAHTSRSDGTSLVLLEAMSCGCPTIALSVGGVQEIIENETTGLLAVAGDWESLANGIIKLLERPNLANMGKPARARVVEYFNIETNTRRASEVLRHIACSGINNQRFTNKTTLVREIVGKAVPQK